MRSVKWNIALSLLALAVWCTSVFLAQRAADFGAGVSVRWPEKEGVSPAQILQVERYAKEDGGTLPDLTLWREHRGQSVARPSGPQASADVTEVFGRAEDLWPLGFLAGNWPARGDSSGCAISERVAHLLWGSSDVLGMSLQWEGRTYDVRGIFRGGGDLVVLQGESGSAERWPGLLLRFPEGGSEEEARQIINRFAFTGGEIGDLPLLAWCLNALAALPSVILAVGLLLRLLRRGWSLRSAPLLLGSYLVPALAAVGLLLWAVEFPWVVPAQLIPTRWADFSFWSRLAGAWGTALRAALTRVPAAWDLALWARSLGCVFLVPTASALVWAAARRVACPTGQAALVHCGVYLGGLFVLALVFAPMGGLVIHRAMWLLPLLWGLIDWGLREHLRLLRPQGEGRGTDAQLEARPKEGR